MTRHAASDGPGSWPKTPPAFVNRGVKIKCPLRNAAFAECRQQDNNSRYKFV